MVHCGIEYKFSNILQKNKVFYKNIFLNLVFSRKNLTFTSAALNHMRKRILILLAAEVVLAASCVSSQPFRFVQMTDPQLGFLDTTAHYRQSDSLFRAAALQANGIGADLVVITGDLVNAPSDALQDSLFRAGVARLKPPVYLLPGNHDVLGQPYTRGPEQFSFRHKGCSFIGLNSNTPDKEWIRQQLQATRGSRFIFVFLHCPVIREQADEPEDYFNFPMEQRREFLNLFREYGVSAVFAGHTHMDHYTEWSGIRLYAAGPVGFPLGRGQSGFLVIDVGKKDFTVRLNRSRSLAGAERAVFIGDSITEVWAQRFDPAFFDGNQRVGRGISGQVTTQMLQRFRADVLEEGATQVIICGGTNDIALNQGPYDPNVTFGNLIQMVALARAYGVRPVLATCLPAKGYWWRPEVTDAPEKIAALNQRIRDYCAANDVPLLDYFAAMVAPDGCSLNPEYTYDGVHPNHAGCQVMKQMYLQLSETAK